MMSDDPVASSRDLPIESPRAGGMGLEGPLDDPKVTQGRHRCIVLGLLFIAACAIAAVVLPLVLDSDCDCAPIRLPLQTKAPTASPPTETETAPPGESLAPSTAPTRAPAPSSPPTSERMGQFVEVFLVPVSGEEVFKDSSSPQYRAAEFLADVDTIAADLPNTEQLGDRYALSTFYYAMDGDDSWFTCFQADENCATGNSWMDPQVNHCEWSAIRCNEEGRVVDVFFTTAEGNGLVGMIPHEFYLLTELENFVAVNNLIGGNFPVSFGEMTNVQRVILNTNVMSGSIPEGFLADAPLEILFLSNNRFSGSIPGSFGNILTLTQLLLANNEFDGTIPSSLAALEVLGTLDLSDNDRLRGSIPVSIFEMANLENLYLNGCRNIQGVLPASIAGLTSLLTLRLGGSGISGSLPDELFTLNGLAELDLTGGQFSGELSEDFSLLSASIRILKLSDNTFSGTIPVAFDSLVLLNTLELDENALTGAISDIVCARRGDGRVELNDLTVDCDEVTCDCCTNCSS